LLIQVNCTARVQTMYTFIAGGSSRKGDLLVDNQGHKYTISKRKAGSVYWLCRKANKEYRCQARVTQAYTDTGVTYTAGCKAHTCLETTTIDNNVDICFRKLAKETAIANKDKTATQISQELLLTLPENAQSAIKPQIKNIMRAVQRSRQNPRSKVPKSAAFSQMFLGRGSMADFARTKEEKFIKRMMDGINLSISYSEKFMQEYPNTPLFLIVKDKNTDEFITKVSPWLVDLVSEVLPDIGRLSDEHSLDTTEVPDELDNVEIARQLLHYNSSSTISDVLRSLLFDIVKALWKATTPKKSKIRGDKLNMWHTLNKPDGWPDLVLFKMDEKSNSSTVFSYLSASHVRLAYKSLQDYYGAEVDASDEETDAKPKLYMGQSETYDIVPLKDIRRFNRRCTYRLLEGDKFTKEFSNVPFMMIIPEKGKMKYAAPPWLSEIAMNITTQVTELSQHKIYVRDSGLNVTNDESESEIHNDDSFDATSSIGLDLDTPFSNSYISSDNTPDKKEDTVKNIVHDDPMSMSFTTMSSLDSQTSSPVIVSPPHTKQHGIPFSPPAMQSPLRQPQASHQTAHRLLLAMNELRLMSTLCDVTLLVGDSSLAAHRVVLAAASKTLAELLCNESHVQMVRLQMDAFRLTDIERLLLFFYTGSINLTNENLLETQHLAEQLDIPLLIDQCKQFVKTTKQFKVIDCEVLQTTLSSPCQSQTNVLSSPKATVVSNFASSSSESHKSMIAQDFPVVPAKKVQRDELGVQLKVVSNKTRISIEKKSVSQNTSIQASVLEFPVNTDQFSVDDELAESEDTLLNTNNSSSDKKCNIDGEIMSKSNEDNDKEDGRENISGDVEYGDDGDDDGDNDDPDHVWMYDAPDVWDDEEEDDGCHNSDENIMVEKIEYKYRKIDDSNICEHCGKSFTSDFYLQTHISEKHQQGVSCTTTSNELGMSVKTNSILMYCCKLCSREFPANISKDHEGICQCTKKENTECTQNKMNKVDGLYNCRECLYSCKTKPGMVAHYRNKHITDGATSIGSPALVCEMCASQFHSKADFIEHLLTEHGVNIKEKFDKNIYECSECKFYSSRLYLVKAHQKKKHAQPCVISCPYCNKDFATEKTLRCHVNTVHVGLIAATCEICSAKFKSNNAFTSHMFLKHKIIPEGAEVYSCTKCNYKNTAMSEVRKHERRCHSTCTDKMHSCEICPLTFRLEKQLIIHQRIHTGQRPFQCNICNYTARSNLTLRSHKKSRHSDIRPHTCDGCGYSCKLSQNLNKHKKYHCQGVVRRTAPSNPAVAQNQSPSKAQVNPQPPKDIIITKPAMNVSGHTISDPAVLSQITAAAVAQSVLKNAVAQSVSLVEVNGQLYEVEMA